MNNQLSDALVVLANVVTAYYVFALVSGVLGAFFSIYGYFKQRALAEELKQTLSSLNKQ